MDAGWIHDRSSAWPCLHLQLGHGDGRRGGEGRGLLIDGGDHVGHRRRGGSRDSHRGGFDEGVHRHGVRHRAGGPPRQKLLKMSINTFVIPLFLCYVTCHAPDQVLRGPAVAPASRRRRAAVTAKEVKDDMPRSTISAAFTAAS